MKKYIGLVVSAALFSLAFSMLSFAGSWKQDARGYWYDNGDGTYPASSWQWIDGNNDGQAESYYFDPTGYLVVNSVVDGYTVNADGAWVDQAVGVVRKQIQASQNGGANMSSVQVENVNGGVSYTFNTLPKNAQELSSITNFSDAKYTGALFIVALKRYVENEADGIAMINVLKGPKELSLPDKSFIKERLSDKKYLPDSYFAGSSPSNNYTASTPYKIVMYNDTLAQSDPNYLRVFVDSSGADSRRYMTLRVKDGNWFIWDYPWIVSGIRVPAALSDW